MYAVGASAMTPVMAGGKREIGNRAVALGIFEVREIVERVFARQDVLDACARRDLGRVIMILGAQGLTQGRISELTGISQGRLSGWARRKRKPRASSVFEAFAGGLGLPPAAREALGLASDGSAGPGLSRPRPARDRIALSAQVLPRPPGRSHFTRREFRRRAWPPCCTGRRCRDR